MQSESRFERRHPWRAITRRCIAGTEKVELMEKTLSNSMSAPLCCNETLSILIFCIFQQEVIDSLLTENWGASGRSHEEMEDLCTTVCFPKWRMTFVFIWDCKLWCHEWTHTPLFKYLHIFLCLGKKMSSKRGRLVVRGRVISGIGDADLLFEVSFAPLECLEHLCNG